MKKFLIWYGVFSVILLFALYTFTLYQGANKRSIEFFNELVADTVESKDATEFIKYQSVAYHELSNSSIGSYHVSLFQVVVESASGYEEHLIVIVIPLSDSAHYATSIDDESDLTRMTLTEDDIVLFDSKIDERYKDHALSYGIDVIGMYYYDIVLVKSSESVLKLEDYDGNEIITQSLSLEVSGYSLDTTFYENGYTQEEKDQLLMINVYVRDELIKNITWFLVVDIVVGGLIWFMLKWIERKKS